MNPDPVYADAPRPSVFADGIEFQDYVCERLAREWIVLQNFASKKYQYSRGENLQGWEIKLDRRCLETGRLSIEIAEKTRRDREEWIKSGIFRGDSWLYIQGNYQRLWIFGTKQLQRYFTIKKPQTDESHGTVRKFYLSLRDAQVVALRVLNGDGDAAEEADSEPVYKSPDGPIGPVQAPLVDEFQRGVCKVCGEPGCIAPHENEIHWS